MELTQHHMLSAGRAGTTSRRAMILGGVGLLHVAVITALITGMAGQIVRYVQPNLHVVDVYTQPPPKPTIVPKTPVLNQPDRPVVDRPIPVPRIVLAPVNPQPSVPVDPQPAHVNPPPADTLASAVVGTHTTPPYPGSAKLLSHQGTVVLLMTVSPQGDVVGATVTTSSGFADLDQAAIFWVVGHWKYKPATAGGVTVTSHTQAAVKFDLKQARG